MSDSSLSASNQPNDPRVEVLAIGDELLDGRVADTNTLRLAHALADVGLRISRRTTILDDIDAILDAARAIVERGTTICVVSGGLGPTADDVTAEAFAKLLAVPLERDAVQAERITAYIKGRGRPVTDNQLKQADRPRGSRLIENPVGTAPGFEVLYQGCRFLSLPGVPHEFDRLIEDGLVAPLRASRGAMLRRFITTFGLFEAQVDDRLLPMAERFPEVRLGFRAHFPIIEVSLKTRHDQGALMTEAVAFVAEALGEHVVNLEGKSVAETVLEKLAARGETVATAESCTGGLVADQLTDIPGSSRVFQGSVVAYANAVKEAQLGVPSATLVAHGAVSEETVRAMAEGVRARLGTSWGIATSGIAGPEGGTAEKPVGTVWIAVAGPSGTTARKLAFPFDRRRTKVLSATAALDLLRRRIS